MNTLVAMVVNHNSYKQKHTVHTKDWLHGFPKLFTDTSEHIRL